MASRQKIAIIGVGLLGGSLALALKKKKGIDLVGWNHRPSSRKKASRLLHIVSTLEEAIQNADVILLCSHSSTVLPLLKLIGGLVKSRALIMDVSSIKGQIVQSAQAIKGLENHFVPCHPMAGKEKSGSGFADGDLYQDHTVFITPLSKNPKALVRKSVQFWKSVGAVPVLLKAQTHDQYVALTSHLPHLLASAYVQLYGVQARRSKTLSTAAGPGFKDFTRIAAGNPAMWSDILEMNSKEVIVFLNQYQRQLASLEKQLRRGNKSFWFSFFEKGKMVRENLK
jgi:prephenate dehydrogenase